MDQGNALESSDMTAAPRAVLLQSAARAQLARLSPPPTAAPPTAWEQPRAARHLGPGLPRGGRQQLYTETGLTSDPPLPAPPDPASASASAAAATKPSPQPGPSVPPSANPHTPAKLSLLPPPAGTQRADVNAPTRPDPGPPPAAIPGVAGKAPSRQKARKSGNRQWRGIST